MLRQLDVLGRHTKVQGSLDYSRENVVGQEVEIEVLYRADHRNDNLEAPC